MLKNYDTIFILLSIMAFIFVFVFALSVITRIGIILLLSVVGITIWIVGMKEKRKLSAKGVVGFGVSLFNILIVAGMIYSVIMSDTYNYAHRLIEIKVLRTAQLIEKLENHGGFHGDGQSYLVFQLNDIELLQMKNQVIENENWSRLPLADIALEKSYLFTEDGYWGTDGLRNALTSTIDGFYYFNPNISTNYGNFTFSILDCNNKILYILRVDT